MSEHFYFSSIINTFPVQKIKLMHSLTCNYKTNIYVYFLNRKTNKEDISRTFPIVILQESNYILICDTLVAMSLWLNGFLFEFKFASPHH